MNSDLDATLEVERTALAWGRTLLGLGGVLGLASADAGNSGRVAAAGVFAVLAVAMIALSWSVARRRATAILAEERRLDSAGSTIAITLVVVALSAAAFVSVLL